MKNPRPAKPLPYTPEAEHPDESGAHAVIDTALRRVQHTTAHDYGWAARGVHAKSHGLLEGELRVLPGLPKKLAQGLFAEPATYPVILRISTNPGDILDDIISTPRGMALKVIGVPGEGLPGNERGTQDFVMANAPAFLAPDAGAFAGNVRLLAATTDTGQGWKKALSATLRGLVRALGSAGIQAGTLKALGGHPLTHPLGETFYSQTPFRYGVHVAKFALVPLSPSLTALTDMPVELAGRPNGLREAVIDRLREHDVEWELRVQLRTNANTMPIENASVAWPETESPYVAVARVAVPRQAAWSEARARQVDDELAFSPWHCLAAHEPLGSINRARRDVYTHSAAFRAQTNGCPLHHPTGKVGLSDTPAEAFGTTRGREGRRPGTPDARPDGRGQPISPLGQQVAVGATGMAVLGLVVTAALLTRGATRRRRARRFEAGGRKGRSLMSRWLSGPAGRARLPAPKPDRRWLEDREDAAVDAARSLVALGAQFFRAARRA